ncbi:hypothetical protein ACNQR7_10800 [Mycolicibacterium senegalense]|uniref:hypothetical protein n=1 Tax=Mycolicibacterium TaxID=1866885 RepID=UPI003204CF9B
MTVLRARYDGDYDKTNLPEELILTNYIVIRDDLIAALFIVLNNAVTHRGAPTTEGPGEHCAETTR